MIVYSANDNDVSIKRRNILTGVATLTAAAAMGFTQNTLAAATEHTHKQHQHTIDHGRQRIIDHAMDCLMKGEACNQHCIELFKTGDTSVADCAGSVQEMLASCTAMSKLAAYDSRHLKAMLNVCIGICEDCEKECRKHEDKHAECKACADSCSDCIKICKEYLRFSKDVA